jgi:ribosomal protein S18 acetylase RimI-like enzyme
MAANRGCKLIKSRRRKPGGDFGRYGLKDAATGREVFGFGGDGLTAREDEVESFLRAGAVSTWKTSLGADGLRAKRAPPRPKVVPEARPARPEPRKEEKPKSAPKPPAVREVHPADAPAIAALLGELGFPADAKQVADRLKDLKRAGEVPLVAHEDTILGCLTWHVMHVLHRPHPVGRISMMVITKKERGRGMGRMLVEAAEARLRERGCTLIEVTSNIDLDGAHAFYRHLGFERSSYRFVKSLAG